MRLFYILLTAALIAASSPAVATQPRKYTEDEKQFFKVVYDSCKKSVTSQLSDEDFQKTICFAHLKGSEEGANQISFMFMWIFMGSEKTCKDLRASLDAFTNGMCAPKNLSMSQFAKDYVSYVDELNESRDVKFYGSPADLYYNIYACDRKTNIERPDGK